MAHVRYQARRVRLRMDRVAVFAFNYFDRESQEWTRAPDLATEQAIRETKCEVLPDTAQEVAASRVARSGILRRPRERRSDPRGAPCPRSQTATPKPSRG